MIDSLDGQGTSAAATRDRALDGLRVIAAFAVFLYHGVTVLGPVQFSHRHWNVFGMLGPIGVSIFFALSGYLLSMPFLSSRTKGVDGRRFVVRRLARILPAYWAALVAFLYVWDRVDVHGVGQVVTYFGLLQNYRFGLFTGGLDVAWTLVMEISFYAFLPVWFAIARVVDRRWPLLGWYRIHVVAASGLVLWGPLFRFWDLYHRPRGTIPSTGAWFDLSTITLWLPGHIQHFAVGMLCAALVHGGWRDRASATTRNRWRWCSVIASIGGVACLVAVDIPPQVLDGTRLQGLQFATAMTVATSGVGYLVFVDRTEAVVRVLRLRPIAWIGQVSFGIYLWHRLIQMELADAFFSRSPTRSAGPMVVAWVLAVLLSVLAGAASFYLIERPAIRLGRRIR